MRWRKYGEMIISGIKKCNLFLALGVDRTARDEGEITGVLYSSVKKKKNSECLRKFASIIFDICCSQLFRCYVGHKDTQLVMILDTKQASYTKENIFICIQVEAKATCY